MSAPLEARGLAFGYAHADDVLRGVDVRLHAGELLVVIGPNGSGKTTLVRLLAGVRAPRTGSVALDGRAPHRMPRREVARRLAVVPQDAPAPFPYAVREMIALGRAPHLGALGREGPGDREAVEAALVELRLSELAARPFPTLSGGERQRVLLARALVQDADLWLLDEPTAQMDLGKRLWALDWLRRRIAAAPAERAVLWVTHDLGLAARFADRVVVLHHGRVAGSGAPGDVLDAALLREVWGVEARVELDAEGRPRIEPLRAALEAPAGE